jgi:UDP-glucose 4-epimerase
VVPTVLGYDPRLQLLHEDDALDVLRLAAEQDRPGTFNVGGDGVLLLSQALRRAGKIAVPVPSPAVEAVGRLVRRTGLVDYSPEQMRFLNFGRVVDVTRLHKDFGYTPRYTTVEAYDDFIKARGLRPLLAQAAVDRAESVASALARRVGASHG